MLTTRQRQVFTTTKRIEKKRSTNTFVAMEKLELLQHMAEKQFASFNL